MSSTTAVWSSHSACIDVRVSRTPTGLVVVKEDGGEAAAQWATVCVDCPRSGDGALCNVTVLPAGLSLECPTGGGPPLRLAVCRRCAACRRLSLRPDLVAEPHWADGDDRTLCCSVRLDAKLDAAVDLVALTRGAQHECAQSAAGDMEIACAACDETIVGAGALAHIDRLPCDAAAAESTDGAAPNADYFCECHCRLAQTQLQSGHGGGGQSPQPEPPELAGPGRLAVSDSWLLLPSDLCGNVRMSRRPAGAPLRAAVVACEQCAAELGIVCRGSAGRVLLHRSAVKSTSPSDGCVDLGISAAALPRHCAWLLLDARAEHACMKFSIESFDRRKYCRIWMMDGYSLMACGKLAAADAAVPGGDGSPPPCHVSAVLKLLYAVCDDDMYAARVPDDGGGGIGAAPADTYPLLLPADACVALARLLVDSTRSLPPPVRHAGNYNVGFLKID